MEEVNVSMKLVPIVKRERQLKAKWYTYHMSDGSIVISKSRIVIWFNELKDRYFPKQFKQYTAIGVEAELIECMEKLEEAKLKYETQYLKKKGLPLILRK